MRFVLGIKLASLFLNVALAQQVDYVNQIKNKPTFDTRVYNFPPQKPGGTISAGNNSVAMKPVPLGMNGTDVSHYAYFSGGTGTAEPCLITGGSGTAGTNGNIIFNCANTHSGSFSISSASAGIQEALTAAGSSGSEVYIPQGNWNVYATISPITSANFHIRGSGRDSTTLTTNYTAGPIFSFINNTNATVEDFTISGPGTGSNYAFNIHVSKNLRLQRLMVKGVRNGINILGPMALSAFRDIEIDLPDINGTGVYINGIGGGEAGGTFDRVFVQGDATLSFNTVGFHFVSGVGALVKDCYTNGVMTATLIDPIAGQTIGVIDFINNNFDGFTTPTQTLGIGIHINPTGGGVVGVIRMTFTGAGGFLYGMVIEGSGSKDIYVNNGYFIGNNNEGIFTTGPGTISNLSLIDNWVEGNNLASGSAPGANLSHLNNLTIRGGVYAAGSYVGGFNSQTNGIALTTVNTALISGAVVAPNAIGTIQFNTGLSNIVIKDTIGYNPVGTSSISVGSSPFTYTAGTSDETVFLSGGTVSSVTLAGHNITGINGIPLSANESIIVTYSVVPTMFKDVK